MRLVTRGAIAAAVAAAELIRQEEEMMTLYSAEDLADGWEFKIVRTAMGSFCNPEKLRTVLEEEKQGGWILVEKFDDSRIRLKRPAGTKMIEGDFADGYDPYRTMAGISVEKRDVIILGIVGFVLMMFVFLGIVLKS